MKKYNCTKISHYLRKGIGFTDVSTKNMFHDDYGIYKDLAPKQN